MRLLTVCLTIALLCTACGRSDSGERVGALEPTKPVVSTASPNVELTSAEPTNTVPVPTTATPEPEGFLLPDLEGVNADAESSAATSTSPSTSTSTSTSTTEPPTVSSAPSTSAAPQRDCSSYHRLFAEDDFYNVSTTGAYVDLVRTATDNLSLASKASMEGWLGLVQFGAYSNDEVKEKTKRLDDNTVADCGVPFIAMSIATSAGFESICADNQDIDPDGGATTTTEAPDDQQLCAYPDRTPPTVFPCFKREKIKNTPSAFFQRGYTNFEVIDCETTEPVVLLLDGTWGPNPLG